MAQSSTLDPVRQQIGRRLIWGAIGVVACLTVLGQALYFLHAATSGSLTNSAIIPKHGSFLYRLDAAVGGALGTSDRQVRRFRISSIQTSLASPHLKDVHVTWALNKGLSSGTVGNGGMLDAYSVLRSIYNSRLPVANVQLIGTYPLKARRSHPEETTVMRLSMSRQVALLIARAGWDTMDPQTVWPLLSRHYVAPDFQPLPSY
jgi:hypothetical protein